jgi:cation:H+ antiporter
MLSYLLLIIGFVLLIKGADLFVDGSSGIARYFRLPPILIGLTIVAFGTSSPEAAVSIDASLKGFNDISLGNILGSNIFNIAFIIGLVSIISPLKVEKETIRKEIPFTLLASLALLVLILDIQLQQFNHNIISRADGIILIMFLLIFIYYLFEMAKNSRLNLKKEVDTEPVDNFILKNSIYTMVGIVGIIIGANLTVKASVIIATQLGLSEVLIGLTIVAVGTSLPELITSLVAVFKKESQIAIGNIVGSNIFNILFVLGTAAVIQPIIVEDKLITDILVMIGLTVVLFIFSRSYRKINKTEGAILLVSYIIYMIFIIMRN